MNTQINEHPTNWPVVGVEMQAFSGYDNAVDLLRDIASFLAQRQKGKADRASHIVSMDFYREGTKACANVAWEVLD